MTDLSKFRFRIGDTVEYKGKPYKIMSYYFNEGVNNFNQAYGYTIDYPCHNGSSCSFNEKGESVSFESRTVMYVNEEETNPIKEEKIKRKSKNTMTKEEAIKFLSNTKVYVDGKSKQIQERLFEIGFSWIEGKEVQHLTAPFLYINKNAKIAYGDNMLVFKESCHSKIKADDILSIKIDEKQSQFKPFERVLVRDRDNHCWRASIFSHIETTDPCSFQTINGLWKQCIPYEGNEYLLGTNKLP